MLSLSKKAISKVKATVIHHLGCVNRFTGTHNLLSFCLASGRKVLPNLNFISSISAAFGFESPKPIPEALPPLQEGVGVPIMGYGRSKLVGEHICGICSRKTGLKTRILRVGQIIGDIRSGVWSTLEAWPLTMRSALSIGALPSAGQHGEKGDEDEICRWLPVDITASTVIDLSLQDETEASSEEGQLGRNGNSDHRSRELEVYNIQHPIPLLWKKDVVPALRKAGLVFDLIPVQEWLSKVESNEDAVANSTIRLADFFRNKYERRRDGEPVTGSEYRIDWTESDQYNALARSKALREAAPVSEELLVRIVQYLMGVWGSENQVK
jgi:thioester reductase-like protein